MRVIHLLPALLLALVAPACNPEPDPYPYPDPVPIGAAVRAPPDTIRYDLREAWDDHAVWTREVILAAVGGIGDPALALHRLYQADAAVGATLATRYGAGYAGVDGAGYAGVDGAERVGRLVAALDAQAELTYRIAKTMRGTADLGALGIEWQANLGRVMLTIAQLDPHGYGFIDVKGLVLDYFDPVIEQIRARVLRRYQDDVYAYDTTRAEALIVADTMAGVLVQPR